MTLNGTRSQIDVPQSDFAVGLVDDFPARYGLVVVIGRFGTLTFAASAAQGI